MKRTEAITAMEEGREVLRRRSYRDGYGSRVRIIGVGYKQRNAWSPISSGGTGAKVVHIKPDGTDGIEAVYPLGQLHLTTQAELHEQNRLAEQARLAERQRIDAVNTELHWRALAAMEVIGGSVERSPYTNVPYLRLTVEDAEALAARLTPTNERN